LFRPVAATCPAPALLWIHGGGYVVGTAAQDDATCAGFAAELGVNVASVDYRLAPEHPYPAALDDCYTALTWLTRLPFVDPTRVAVGGASAGGGLAAALALVARDEGIALTSQLLVAPMLDDRSSESPARAPRGRRLWNYDSNKLGWTAYLADADPEIAVPARRQDLSGLPPTWIGVGSLDLFHDESVDYAGRLNRAGVPCELHVVPGAFHGFDVIMPRTSLARNYFQSQCAMLRRAFTTE
jgi:acetyl esterase/lipase